MEELDRVLLVDEVTARFFEMSDYQDNRGTGRE